VRTIYLSPFSSRLGGILDEWTSSDLVKIAHLEKNAVGEDMFEKARRMRMERSSQKRNPLIAYQRVHEQTTAASSHGSQTVPAQGKKLLG